MKPKHIYTNVISELEEDSYKITIKDPSIKNFAVVLNQNTGQTLLRCDYYITERNTFDLNEQKQNSNFLPNLIKISTKLLHVGLSGSACGGNETTPNSSISSYAP